MRRELVDNLDRVGRHLIEELDPENGLFPAMLSQKVLTRQQVERCQAKATSSDKVEAVLLLLRRRPDDCYAKFCDILVDLDQRDLVDLYLQPTRFIRDSPSESTGSRWSASSENDLQTTTTKRILGCRDENDTTKRLKAMTSFEEAFRGKHLVLMDKLDINNGLLTALRDKGVLTNSQIDEIDHSMKTGQKSVEALLKTLEKRPDTDFEKFCECLLETNQRHIKEELLGQSKPYTSVT
jgi:hypothetical protein